MENPAPLPSAESADTEIADGLTHPLPPPQLPILAQHLQPPPEPWTSWKLSQHLYKDGLLHVLTEWTNLEVSAKLSLLFSFIGLSKRAREDVKAELEKITLSRHWTGNDINQISNDNLGFKPKSSIEDIRSQRLQLMRDFKQKGISSADDRRPSIGSSGAGRSKNQPSFLRKRKPGSLNMSTLPPPNNILRSPQSAGGLLASPVGGRIGFRTNRMQQLTAEEGTKMLQQSMQEVEKAKQLQAEEAKAEQERKRKEAEEKRRKKEEEREAARREKFEAKERARLEKERLRLEKEAEKDDEPLKKRQKTDEITNIKLRTSHSFPLRLSIMDIFLRTYQTPVRQFTTQHIRMETSSTLLSCKINHWQPIRA
ncbi:hypothetical protein BKA69DRAFT_35532 [Paraphysoderma sedebokerense]|nr:hypothetical protein BKA69DRAFT_35532 [Paraphysoderma sedebokerense]